MKFIRNIFMRVLFSSLLFSLLLMPAWAKTNDVAAAQQRVLQVTQEIAKNLEVNKAQYNKNPALLNRMIRAQVLPFIDFDAMSKLTLGNTGREQHQRNVSVL